LGVFFTLELLRLTPLGELSFPGGYGETLELLFHTLLRVDDLNQIFAYFVIFRTNMDFDRQVAISDGLTCHPLVIDPKKIS
jgi:hypothetical protein